MKIKNWKLNEIVGKFDILENNSPEYISHILMKLNVPVVDTYSPNRSQTEIDWLKMRNYYSFFTDDKNELLIKGFLKKSLLGQSRNVIITYGWEEPVIIIPIDLFLQDWEGFVRSKLWEGFIFSEDFELIIECTRDYYIHSNFEIFPNSKNVVK